MAKSIYIQNVIYILRDDTYKYIIGDIQSDDWFPPPEYETPTGITNSKDSTKENLIYDFHFPEEWERHLYNIRCR